MSHHALSVLSRDMARWLDSFSDQAFRATLGERLEALAYHAYSVLRWAVVVGFARFLTLEAPSVWFDTIYWMTSAMLLAYLASIFLLRPEVPLFHRTDQRWKRLTQTAVNLILCMIAFILVIRGIDALAEGVARYRFTAAPV